MDSRYPTPHCRRGHAYCLDQICGCIPERTEHVCLECELRKRAEGGMPPVPPKFRLSEYLLIGLVAAAILSMFIK